MNGAKAGPGERARVAPIIPATLRTLAADLRAGSDLPALLGALGRALAAVPTLRGFTVDPPREAPEFDPDRLSIPLLGSSGALGTMKVAAGGSGTFHSGRLHLAGALADLAAVMIEHALMARTRTTPAELIAIALADVPVGVLCFDGSNALVFANPAAHHLLGGRIPVDWPSVWSALAPAGRKEPGTSFVLRQGSRLVHAVARRAASAAPGAIVLTDLAARLNAFGEVLSGEVYRSLVEKQPLHLGVIAAGAGSPAALEAVELARQHLPAGARVGPVDAEAMGILATGAPASALWPVLQQVARGWPGGDELRGGVAALHESGDTPGALLARAAAGLRPLGADVRPGVLVCDRSAAVNDTLALILRRDFLVTAAGRWADGLALLQEQAFDGLVLELPGRGDEAALDFARAALQLQPAARRFFLTEQPGPWDLGELRSPGAPVFRKPFVVRDVRTAFKTAFAGASG